MCGKKSSCWAGDRNRWSNCARRHRQERAAELTAERRRARPGRTRNCQGRRRAWRNNGGGARGDSCQPHDYAARGRGGGESRGTEKDLRATGRSVSSASCSIDGGSTARRARQLTAPDLSSFRRMQPNPVPNYPGAPLLTDPAKTLPSVRDYLAAGAASDESKRTTCVRLFMWSFLVRACFVFSSAVQLLDATSPLTLLLVSSSFLCSD